MRREALYLRDILDASDAIQRYIAGVDEAGFLSDDMLRSAVLHQLMVIGEACARLPAELRSRREDIEWQKIVGFRNVIVHGYFGLVLPLVWEAATIDVPPLRAAVAEIIEIEFPDLRMNQPEG